MPEGVPYSNSWTTSGGGSMPRDAAETRRKSWEGREREFLDQVLIHDGNEAPEFVLLDLRGPSRSALVASVVCLSALLMATVFLANHRSAARSPVAGVFRSIVVVRPALSLPAKPGARRRVDAWHLSKLSESRLVPPANRVRAPSLPRRSSPSPLSRSLTPPGPWSPPGLIARVFPARGEIPAPVPEKPHSTVVPLPPARTTSQALSLVDFPPKPLLPPAVRPSTPAMRDLPKRVADTFGTLPLPTLLRREAVLAASLEALPRRRRLALPRVSIRVDATWIEALPQTHEKLYFSFTVPQGDTRVLAYSAESKNFSIELALRPLWQIRDVDRVPALVFLRQAAARRLGVPPALVSLYTWHPPLFENALRMFVLERMEQLGIALDAADVVAVRVLSGPNGYVMRLDPVRAAGLPPQKRISDTLPD
jgi:hypothetical protein